MKYYALIVDRTYQTPTVMPYPSALMLATLNGGVALFDTRKKALAFGKAQYGPETRLKFSVMVMGETE